MEIIYNILIALSAIVSLIFIFALFMYIKRKKYSLYIELISSIMMVVTNIILLIVEFNMNKPYYFTITMIFSWLLISIYKSIQFGIASEMRRSEKNVEYVKEDFKKTLEEILKEDKQNARAKIAYASRFGSKVNNAKDGFIY